MGVPVNGKDVHFYVINLEKSKNRLRVMKDQFKKLGLPMFERSVKVNAGPHELRRGLFCSSRPCTWRALVS